MFRAISNFMNRNLFGPVGDFVNNVARMVWGEPDNAGGWVFRQAAVDEIVDIEANDVSVGDIEPPLVPPPGQNLVIAADGIYPYVRARLRANGVPERRPIRLKITSATTGQFVIIVFPSGLNGIYEWWQNNFTVDNNYQRVVMGEYQPSVFDNCIVNILPYEERAGGCGKKDTKSKTYNVNGFDIVTQNVVSDFHNCGLQGIIDIGKNNGFQVKTIAEMREMLGHLDRITISEIQNLFTLLHNTHLCVATSDSYDGSFTTSGLFLTDAGHFRVIKSVGREKPKRQDGLLFYDLETRPFEQVGIKYGHPLRDENGEVIFREGIPIFEELPVYRQRETIISVVYKNASTGHEFRTLEFATTYDNTWHFAGQKFLEWMSGQTEKYICFAHNGSRFDIYFLLSHISGDDLKAKKTSKGVPLSMVMRGLSIINLKWKGHEFRDTCCFLPKSLSDLCKDFKPRHGKQTVIQLPSGPISSEELCFYKPHLSFAEFMNLKDTEYDGFWQFYSEYCLYDVLSLCDIFNLFETEINTIISKVSDACGLPAHELKKKGCSLRATLTIGSLAKKLFLANPNEKDKRDLVAKFVQTDDTNDFDKYTFLKKFVRGGISYVQYPGKHDESIVLYDIKSMYPASMKYMVIPCGDSEFVRDDEAVEAFMVFRPGFYHLKNVVFQTSRFRPCAATVDAEFPRKSTAKPGLSWSSQKYDELYLDSYMIRFLFDTGDVFSCDIEQALVSKEEVNSRSLFSHYVDLLYAEKQHQDDLPRNERNNALRETIKLLLNSLSGKLVEDPSTHKDFYAVEPDVAVVTDITYLNGIEVTKLDRVKINPLFTIGLMIYSHSKRGLFSYIDLLPNGREDVIASETDSIYVPEASRAEFERRVGAQREPIQIGDRLGNFAYEGRSVPGSSSYFLGKKQYLFPMEDSENKLKFKGFCSTRIVNGKKEKVLNEEVFMTLYTTGKVTVSQSNLKRRFDGKSEDSVIHMESGDSIKRFATQYEYRLFDAPTGRVEEK